MVGMLSYLISFLGIVFWIFRLAVVFCASMKIDIGILPMDLTKEIIVLFLSIPCFALILKRNLAGAFAYFIIFAFYFGNDLFNQFTGTMNIQAVLIDFFGLILPLMSLIDIAVNRDRMRNKRR